MKCHVFLGPSLSIEEARRILPGAVYRPPVTMGDVIAVVRSEEPAAIAIVDGLFERTPAVWHKEILHALSLNIAVFGAASMGALRAAELHPFGMIGVGRVFEAFRDGELEDDDEVAITHGPPEDGCPALSDAMVNLRHGLAMAERRGEITEQTREALVREAKSMFYAERTWASVLRRGRARGVPETEISRLRSFVQRERPDLKRDDAIRLLSRLRDLRPGDAPARDGAFVFEATTFWAKLVRATDRDRLARANEQRGNCQ
jgi:hypothetical protein